MGDKNDTQLDSEAATQNEPKQNEFGLLPCPFCGTTDLEPYPDGDM